MCFSWALRLRVKRDPSEEQTAAAVPGRPPRPLPLFAEMPMGVSHPTLASDPLHRRDNAEAAEMGQPGRIDWQTTTAAPRQARPTTIAKLPTINLLK